MMASTFSVIPSAAIFDERLGLGDLRVLCAVGSFADHTGKCWPATTTLAQKLRVSVRHVRACLRTLEACGYVQTEHRPGQRSIYLIILKPSDPGSQSSGVDAEIDAYPGSGSSAPPEVGVPGTPEVGVPPNRTTNGVNKQLDADEKTECYQTARGLFPDRDSGSLVTKLLQVMPPVEALAAIESARTKDNPWQYLWGAWRKQKKEADRRAERASPDHPADSAIFGEGPP